MADLALRIRSDFEQAEADFKSLASTSEAAAAKVERFASKFKAEQIDKFTARNKLAATAVTATSGKLAGMQKEAQGLEREIQRLIRSGMAPQDEALKKLQADYIKLSVDIDKNTDATKQGATAQNGFNQAIKTALAYFSARAILTFTKDIVMAASDVEELGNKYNVVFSGIQKETDAWINKYSQATARGVIATKEYLTTLQDIRTGFGDNVASAAQFSQAVVGVTNDLSSFSNVDFESASAAIQSGLSGQFEALRSLGVGLNVAIIDQGKYAESIGKSWKEMTNLEKQEAVLSGIMEQSKNAIGQNISVWSDYNFALGDAANTSGSFANQQKLLEQSQKDLYAVLGSLLLPAMTQLITLANKILGDFTKWASQGDNLKNGLIALTGIILGIAGAIGVWTVASTAAAIANGALAVSEIPVIAGILAINKAIMANPFGFLATVITAVLIPAIIWAATHFDEFKVLLMQGWEIIKIGAFNMAKAIIKYAEIMFLPFIKGIDLVIMGFNKISGKEIPTLSQNLSSFTGKLDEMAAASSGKIGELQSQRAKMARESANAEQTATDDIASSQAQRLENEALMNETLVENQEAEQERRDANVESFKAMLEEIALTEEQHNNKMMNEAESFWINRAKLESDSHIARLAYLKTQYKQIETMDNLSNAQKLAAQKALTKAIKDEQTRMYIDYLTFAKDTMAVTQSILQDTITTMNNLGKNSRRLAQFAKGIAIAQATINSLLAFTNALKDYPWPLSAGMGALALAAGTAKVAAIATTPIPSAQTGGSFTVPEMPETRNDQAAIMASAGETVSVTPRGEDEDKNIKVNVSIGEEVLINIVQNAIDTGQINVSDKNIGQSVFA